MKAKVIFLLFVFAICGCEEFFMPKSFKAVEEDRAMLINGIESYQSMEEFLASLEDSALKWEIHKVGSLGKTKKAPLDILTIKIHDYTHIGHSGDLYVKFFNNRLAWTFFYPEDINAYIGDLARQGIVLDSDMEYSDSKFARVRVVEHAERGILIERFIRWYDIRLDREFDIWHYRYS